MSDHTHGSMDITEQEKTFSGFIKLGKWTIGICVAILVFLAIFTT